MCCVQSAFSQLSLSPSLLFWCQPEDSWLVHPSSTQSYFGEYQNNTELAPRGPVAAFLSQAYRTCQRIQIISCFTTTEWNKNARVDMLILFIYKVCKTWHSHLPFAFPCCLFAVCIPRSRKTVQYILMYLSSSKCSIRQKLRPGMEIWQSKLWNHHLWSQTLSWRCRSCPWTQAAHRGSRGQQWVEWRFPSEAHRCKENATLNGKTNCQLIRQFISSLRADEKAYS